MQIDILVTLDCFSRLVSSCKMWLLRCGYIDHSFRFLSFFHCFSIIFRLVLGRPLAIELLCTEGKADVDAKVADCVCVCVCVCVHPPPCVQDEDGNTPLHLAAEAGDLDCTNALVS